MKGLFRCFGMMAALFMAATMVHAADVDVTGTWNGAFDFNGNSVPVVMTLKADGAAVTGTLGGLGPAPIAIHDGKVDAGKLTFWLNTDYEGQTYKIMYTGKVSADSIDMTFGTEDGSWGSQMVMKRGAGSAAAAAGPDVTGQWKGSFDFNGTSMPVVFDLKAAGGAVTGTVTGMGPAPAEIHDGKADGDRVTFWITTEYEGQTYTIQYKGKMGAGQIDFSFGTPDGGWGSTVTAKKV